MIEKELIEWIFIGLVGSGLLLWTGWVGSYGFIRGSVSVLCRALWVAPIFIALFPVVSSQELPRSVEASPIHILIDDSESMQAQYENGQTYADRASKHLKKIEDSCRQYGCRTKVSRFSDFDERVKEGYTPLNSILKSWFYKTGRDPWIILSDGGASQPTSKFSRTFSGLGQKTPSGIVEFGSMSFAAHGSSGSEVPTPKVENPIDANAVKNSEPQRDILSEQAFRMKAASSEAQSESGVRGFILGYYRTQQKNYFLQSLDVPRLSFEGKSIAVEAVVHRSSDFNVVERVQVQALLNGKSVATTNAQFEVGDKTAVVSMIIPPLRRGSHLVSLRTLPVVGEKILWDNEVTFNMEVMVNTLGVLHLLGSPSWDGRFLRRYFKSEPKYDLISFFILRDPWDSQQVTERELSLIPFPVDRLFNEELPNFRVIVVQNFTVLQFLQPANQRQLVKFVKDGGGLLFLGGPRALKDADLRDSPLREILPFAVPERSNLGGAPRFSFSPAGGSNQEDHSGPWYDAGLEYKIKLAKPEVEERKFANVYDDWEGLGHSLESLQGMRGIHHMENVKFKAGGYTPLLYAKTVSGKKIPLAVASYPGKGRAIWLFTDSSYRLAMTQNKNIPRQSYHRFFEGAMTWLLRQDLNKPLSATSFEIFDRGIKSLSKESISMLAEPSNHSWSATLQGPAVRYYTPSKDWEIKICGQNVNQNNLRLERTGRDRLKLYGKIGNQLRLDLKQRGHCRFEIKGTHSAFGSLHASFSGAIPKTFMDSEMGAAPQRLSDLAVLTGAEMVQAEERLPSDIAEWVANESKGDGVALPRRFKSVSSYYWILSSFWIWFLLSFLPIEILVRRWDKIRVFQS